LFNQDTGTSEQAAKVEFGLGATALALGATALALGDMGQILEFLEEQAALGLVEQGLDQVSALE